MRITLTSVVWLWGRRYWENAHHYKHDHAQPPSTLNQNELNYKSRSLSISLLSLSELLLRLKNSPEIIGPCVIDSSVQTLNSVSLCVFTCCWLLHQHEWRGNETLPRQIPLATCIRKLHATRNVDLVGKEIQIGTRTVLLSISESDRESESLAPRTPTTTTVDSRFSARTNSYCSCWGKSKFVKCIQISAITFHGRCTEWVNETSMSSRTFAPKALGYR